MMHERARLRKCAAAWVGLLLVVALVPAARADEAAILNALREYFQSDDPQRQEALVAQIAADPGFDRAKLVDWLHNAGLFPPQEPGTRSLAVPLADGRSRQVLLRVPGAYDPAQRWPLIYALHGQGQQADQIMKYVEHVLGPRIDEFIVAAPDQYEEMMLNHAHWPPLDEHGRVRALLRREFHLDPARVHVIGYSMGGHAAWNEALLSGDDLASAMPLAATLLAPEPERLWEFLLPSLARPAVICVWGAEDRFGMHGEQSEAGGIAGLNRKLREAIAAAGLANIEMIELPDADHFNVLPPADAVERWLAARRETWPASVRRVFRHESQARAAWLEGDGWAGDQWTDQPPKISVHETIEEPATPERVSEAVAAAYRGWMGEIKGEVQGQAVRVSRKRLKELTVWFGDGMIDWSKQVEIKVNGRVAYQGTLRPDLAVCLQRARATRDFDRLAWAGVRYRSGGRGRVIGAPEPD